MSEINEIENVKVVIFEHLNYLLEQNNLIIQFLLEEENETN
ncbi:MAG: hypothetical protein ACK5NF_02295 [Bacilli bacterium]